MSFYTSKADTSKFLNLRNWLFLWLTLVFGAFSAQASFPSDIKLLPQWERVIKASYARFKPLTIADIRNINKEINYFPYISDLENYGKYEHWATIEEFYANNGGDCEDYAIAKYFRFIELGVPTTDMSIVIGSKKHTNFPHAALLIKHHGKRLYLDSNNNNLNDERKYFRHFSPIYFANVTDNSGKIAVQVAFVDSNLTTK